MRRPLVAGNWKMHKLPSEAGDWLESFLAALAGEQPRAELLLNVPATHLAPMARVAAGSVLGLGGQDLSEHDQGAYTGEISGAMLRDAGARYVVVGHSERRANHGESDEIVGRKVAAARRHGLVPILCVGESEEQRDGGRAREVVLSQLRRALQEIEPQGAAELVIAYEPVWAIGTGRTATGDDAQEMCAAIRDALAGLYPQLADDIRILYGGSMKPANAAELMAQGDIDGGLIGGASLEVDSLLAIARAV